MDPSSDVTQYNMPSMLLSTTCQPSLPDIIVMMIMTSRKYRIMAPMTFSIGQMRISPSGSPETKVSTTKQCLPRALIATEMRVSSVMGNAGTLLFGVMTSAMDFVITLG